MKKVLLTIMVALLLVGCAKSDVNNTEAQKPNLNTTESEDVMTEDVVNTEIVATESEESVQNTYTFTEMNTFMYAKSVVDVRDLPSSDGNKIGELTMGQEVNVGGQCNETGWYKIGYNGVVGYVSNNYLVDTKPDKPEPDDPVDPEEPDEPDDPKPDEPKEDDDIVTYGKWRFRKSDMGWIAEDTIKLAKAGYGVIVDFTCRQGCGILISSFDATSKNTAEEQLTAHIRALGYEPGGFTYDGLKGCLDDGVWVVYCDSYWVPSPPPEDW